MVHPLPTAPLSKDAFGAKFLRTFSFLLLCALSSCSLSGKAMTQPDFEQIQRGMTIEQVIAESGEPYTVTSSQDGKQRYTYIERIDTGPGRVSQNTYTLIVVNGQVVDKCSSNDASVLNFQYR